MRVYHPAAQYFDPSRSFAEPAAASAAFKTGNIHFCAGFRKWEMVGTELHFRLIPEQFPGKFRQCTFQIRKCNIFVDHQPLDLMEGRGVGGIHFIGAEHPSRRDHTNGKLSFFHFMHLGRRSLRPEKNISRNIKRILLIFCGVPVRYIQRLEIIVVFFHFGSFHHLIAHAHKDSFHFFQSDCIRMAVSYIIFFRRKGNIDHFRFHPGFPERPFHFYFRSL